ncbi:MAG: hypothetical protein RLZZ450_3797 [Pseudomonadota bacterium]
MHPDSSPLSLSGPAASRPGSARAKADRDLELIAKVAHGDLDATELLAERMAPRALRVARSLMAGADDASDAALHALIELLRSHARYRGQLRLERWADRVMALSVVRFARAVRRRDQVKGVAPAALPALTDERGARTFEQYLTLLPEQSRQILLLRHGLAFALGELAEALSCSLPVAREQLRGARRELRALVRRKSDGAAAALGEGAQRWCALRDREALGESLAPDEHEELTQLEARDAEVWAFVAQVRALELFFDAARETPQSGVEHELAARSVAALEITSDTLRTRALELESATETGPDFEGSHVVRKIAVASSVLLAAASAVALWLYDPPAAPDIEQSSLIPADAQASSRLGGADPVALQPTVEPLPTARTARHGAKLRTGGKLLQEGTLLTQGDLLETSDRPGCLQVAPDSEVCLAPMTQIKLTSLRPRERSVELLTGRVVVRVVPLSESARWSLRAGKVEVVSPRAVFSAERVADSKLLRVRTLRAGVLVQSGTFKRELAEAHTASLRLDGALLEVAVLLPSQAQRDWELLATGLYPATAAKVPAVVATPASAASAVAPTKTSNVTPVGEAVSPAPVPTDSDPGARAGGRASTEPPTSANAEPVRAEQAKPERVTSPAASGEPTADAPQEAPPEPRGSGSPVEPAGVREPVDEPAKLESPLGSSLARPSARVDEVPSGGAQASPATSTP